MELLSRDRLNGPFLLSAIDHLGTRKASLGHNRVKSNDAADINFLF